MTQNQEIKKEDIAANPIYRMIARTKLAGLHNNLMRSLYRYFSGRKDKKNTLLVIGQGPEVLPFSRNLDLVEEMIGDGNIAMIDYNTDILSASIDALVNPRFESDEVVPEQKRKGITERGYEIVDNKDIDKNRGYDNLDLRTLGNRKVIVRHGNILNSLGFEDNSISAVDATLCIHHATAYKKDLVGIINKIYRVLEPNGLFHFGTGNVNMRHQEEKIHRIATEAQKFYNEDVLLQDMRCFDTGVEDIAIVSLVYERGKSYTGVPVDNTPVLAPHLWNEKAKNQVVNVRITKEGMVEVDSGHRKKAKEFKAYLASKGFKQIYANEHLTVLPIIDPGMEDDRKLHLESVKNYYEPIIALGKKYFAGKPDIAAKLYEAEQKEFGDAARGLFEYYTDPKIIMSVLKDAGFRSITYEQDNTGIWCNMTAVKD